MRRRTLLTIVLIGLMLTISLLVFVVIVIVRGQANVDDNLVTAEQVQAKKKRRIVDPFAAREVDAVRLVQNRKVLDPSYVKAVIEQRKAAEKLAVEEANKPKRRDKVKEEEIAALQLKVAEVLTPSTVTIQDLVARKYLEQEFNMSFLVQEGWRSMQLDTDAPPQFNADPFYEVYLDYRDEEVIIGPVWVVNVETGDVVPRNDMAEFFEFNENNYEQSQELLSRPARVVRAITSHVFKSGISLGGTFLLHFVNRPEKHRKPEDRIIGWTVNHEFKNYYNAYFQWVEAGEHRVARFRFDWKAQKLEPKGLLAIDLMAEGEDREEAKPVDIWPVSYERNLGIPREERWKEPTKTACKEEENKPACDAFAMVLEQEDFIVAVEWLLTANPDMVREFQNCIERKDCKWRPAPDAAAPGTFTIQYEYIVLGEKKSIGFKVDPAKNSISPNDEISRWAFWSVTPRT